MPERYLTIPVGELSLEGVLHTPAGAGPYPAIVVCHPHPLYGGTMDNNVVTAVVRSLTDRGLAALRFNFRGVGQSGGHHDHGRGEREDVRAARAYAATLAELEPARIGLAGYSFGAMMAAAVADAAVPALALIAPPLGMGPDLQGMLTPYSNPLLLIAGDHDHVCPAATLRDLAAGLPAAEVHVVTGTDHFWVGRERDLAEAVGDFFARHLSAAF